MGDTLLKVGLDMTRKHILRAVMLLTVAMFISVVLLALPKTGHRDWGSLSNDWNTQAFGWPFEVWTRTIHSYTEYGSPGWVEMDRSYSIHWGRALGLYLGTATFVACAAVCLQKLRPK
jgi:hypothetical protein